MRYPEFLSEGGTIGFVAPSFGCATEPYKTAFGMTIKRFEKEGYTVGDISSGLSYSVIKAINCTLLNSEGQILNLTFCFTISILLMWRDENCYGKDGTTKIR